MPRPIFIDSSALVKRYRNEAGSDETRTLLRNVADLFISRLTVVEVSSALIRRASVNRSSRGQLDAALADFDYDIRESYVVIEIEKPLMDLAVLITRSHGLRGADSIQLASGLSIRGAPYHADTTFVASDHELIAAAMREGFHVIDPTRPITLYG